jgi:hypothetical protein
VSDAAAISALLSAAAVVGALTTSSLLVWYVEVSELGAEVDGRTSAERKRDDLTRELDARHGRLTTRQRALAWVAGLHGIVVATLLGSALWLSYPFGGRSIDADLWPFFVASVAMAVALLVVPLLLTLTAWNRLGRAGQALRRGAS